MTKQDKLSAAREKLLSSGKSPVQIGKESKLTVLHWVYLWGFITASIVLLLLKRTSGGYLEKLVKQGLLVATRSGLNSPKYIYTLSVVGLQIAEKFASYSVPYPEINPRYINFNTITHCTVAQRETILALQDGYAEGFETEKVLTQKGGQRGVKQVDVKWMHWEGYIWGVEVELNGKWGRVLDEFILKIINALTPDKSNQSAYDLIIVVSDSPPLLKRYQEAMKPGVLLCKWKKNARGHWDVVEKVVVPDWLINRVKFELID